jgi:hypothetical protein
MKGHKAHHHEHPRAEHKKGGKVHRAHHASGGSEHPTKGDWDHDEAPKEVYAGAGSHVVKEAEEKKRGGRTKRKHGGHVHHMGKVHGEHAKHRADRPKRKSGGKVGADRNPLSSAHGGKEPSGHRSYEPEHD